MPKKKKRENTLVKHLFKKKKRSQQEIKRQNATGRIKGNWGRDQAIWTIKPN